MATIWTVTPDDVMNLGRTGEGKTFTSFVDALLRGYALRLGISQSEVETNLQVNLGDGGVDTRITAGPRTANPEPFGWFSTKSVWQYKATDMPTDSELAVELSKPYVIQQVKEGYEYRLCVCTDVTVQTREARLIKLKELVRAINDQAPEPRILLAGDLAELASVIPALKLRFFSRQESQVQHLVTWAASARGDTPLYIANPAWNTTTELVKAHLDFGKASF